MTADHLADLEFRHLLSFRAVAETGSFHEAAVSLDYTQSAVSQYVAALESILGVRLLERSRGRRTVAVTEAGVLLLRHADAIVARMEAGRAEIQGFAAGGAGRVGCCFVTQMPSWLGCRRRGPTYRPSPKGRPVVSASARTRALGLGCCLRPWVSSQSSGPTSKSISRRPTATMVCCTSSSRASWISRSPSTRCRTDPSRQSSYFATRTSWSCPPRRR